MYYDDALMMDFALERQQIDSVFEADWRQAEIDDAWRQHDIPDYEEINHQMDQEDFYMNERSSLDELI